MWRAEEKNTEGTEEESPDWKTLTNGPGSHSGGPHKRDRIMTMIDRQESNTVRKREEEN